MSADGPTTAMRTGRCWRRTVPSASARSPAWAHGWASGATAALSGFVLGVRPASPGYATWTVAPHPGDLRWVRGRVPTPHGAIAVSWGKAGHALVLDVAAPHRTAGTIAVPVTRTGATITADGRTVWSHGRFHPVPGITAAHATAGAVRFTVHGGHHRLTSH